MNRTALITVAFVLAASAPAAATSSGWQQSEGGSVRLVTAGGPDAQGKLKGGLQIRLKPGWKTYWRDPGGSGVPPQIDLSASANVVSSALMFPPPERIDDGNAQTAGYHRSVTLPVVFSLKDATAPTRIDANVFLGICKDICIPVQAHFVLDPAADPDTNEDGAIVAEGFSALPDAATPAFGVSGLRVEGDELVADVTVPAGAGTPVLFMASADGFMLGLSERRQGPDGGTAFAARIFHKPDDRKPARFPYTLIAGDRAVSGAATLN